MEISKSKMSLAAKVNIIRAGVMGANDGIISVAGIVIGVAGASVSNYAILLSGLAGMLAGTISMAMGEWVSVSTQRDSEKVATIRERERFTNDYAAEFEYIKNKYIATGISEELAHKATSEMLSKNPVEVGVRERYGFNPNEQTSAIFAALASMISFPIGSALPLILVTVSPEQNKIIATVAAVVVALVITGWLAAKLGDANPKKAVLRNVISGLLTMTITFLIGSQFA